MTRNFSVCLYVSLVVILSGCGQANIKQDPATGMRTVPYSIATSADLGADVIKASTYTWLPGMHTVHETPSLSGVPVRHYLESAINNAIAAKGYRFSSMAAADTLLVGYRVILGETTDATQPARDMGVSPGLVSASPDTERFERGTLVILIVDNLTRRTLWRSALQGFADMDIPADVRQRRINEIVASMLAGFPARTHSRR